MKEDKRLKQIQKLLDVAEGNLHSARNLLLDILGEKKTGKVDHTESAKDLSILDDGKIIEGIFDGEQMMAPDGKKYPVPANYASKSKLIEGDVLKLTIADDGSLMYKQIKPAERKNLIGTLAYDNGDYSILAEGKNYKVLFASVTYYKGKPGDKASITVPSEKDSNWAALESIIHDHDGDETPDEETIKDPEKKVTLPEENIKILESVKERAEVPESEDTDEIPETKEDTGSRIPKIKKVETINADDESSSDEKEVDDAGKDTPSGVSHTFMSGDEDFVKEEKDTNALGEEISGKDDKGIQELEI